MIALDCTFGIPAYRGVTVLILFLKATNVLWELQSEFWAYAENLEFSQMRF